MTYAAMAIGQSFKKNKGLMSVVFFFVLWIGTRIVLTPEIVESLPEEELRNAETAVAEA